MKQCNLCLKRLSWSLRHDVLIQQRRVCLATACLSVQLYKVYCRELQEGPGSGCRLPGRGCCRIEPSEIVMLGTDGWRQRWINRSHLLNRTSTFLDKQVNCNEPLSVSRCNASLPATATPQNFLKLRIIVQLAQGTILSRYKLGHLLVLKRLIQGGPMRTRDDIGCGDAEEGLCSETVSRTFF